MATFFVTGIDTGVGKTFATGLMARYLLRSGFDALTAKLVQTGAVGFSEDIVLHRALMGVPSQPEDADGSTCPALFAFPGSPALAAELEGGGIDTGRLTEIFSALAARREILLVEGAGGWLVPLTATETTADFVAYHRWPVAVVTSSRLGSINHTLLTLEAVATRKLPVMGIVYNRSADENPVIAANTRAVLSAALDRLDRSGALVDLWPVEDVRNPPEVDFSPLFRGFADG